jgi:CRP/FNR family cyclic AMP-dependent transcriptional regulator
MTLTAPVSSVLKVRDALAALPQASLRGLLSAGERVHFEKNTALVRQGEPSDALYLLLWGRVLITRTHPDLKHPLVLATLGPGEVVGEMGLLDETTRSATITAIDEVVIARRISTRDFAELIVRSPEIYGGLVRLMSARLRSTDELLTELVAGHARERS